MSGPGTTNCPTCGQRVIIFDDGDDASWLNPGGTPHVHGVVTTSADVNT